MPRNIPVPDELSKPFWDAVDQRRLVLQNCTACNRLQHPPLETCFTCGSAEHLEWRQVSGRGHIHDYVVQNDSRVRRAHADQPFNLAVITLDEDPGINLWSNLPGIPVGEVPVGAAVELVFEELVPVEGEELPVRLVPEWRVVK